MSLHVYSCVSIRSFLLSIAVTVLCLAEDCDRRFLVTLRSCSAVRDGYLSKKLETSEHSEISNRDDVTEGLPSLLFA